MSEVYLYIGGPVWETKALERIRQIVDKDKVQNVGYIVTSGTRYNIIDHISYLSSLGGGKKVLYTNNKNK